MNGGMQAGLRSGIWGRVLVIHGGFFSRDFHTKVTLALSCKLLATVL
jgi:hypothetical protein